AKIHAAPVPSLSLGPPRIAVFPSAEIATANPNRASAVVTSSPTSLACWLQLVPLLTNTQAAPTGKVKDWSKGPPEITVLPSAEIATADPWPAPCPPTPVPINLVCSLQTLLVRMKTHAAPKPPVFTSRGPPTIAAVPFPDSPTESP